MERRLTWLARIVLIWGAAVFLKLLWLQVVQHGKYVGLARARQEIAVEVPAPRGTIYDRAGRVLAMSVPTESVYVNPLKLPDLDVASELLSRALHLDGAELAKDLHSAFDSHRGFLWVKRKITPEEGQRLRDMHLEWIGMQRESQRHYPKGSLAAHVLGSVDFEERGNAGIEKYLDKDLRGVPGVMRLLTDVKRRGIDSHLATEARPGASLTLTIDERMQYLAEQQIATAVEAHHAASGSVVVMNPYTGDIMALASYPPYDPNLPPLTPEDNARRLNHAVSVPFEPGSVYKVITLSAALETTRLRPESPINCHGGVLKLPGRIVHDSHGGLGIIPMAMVLAKSSNIGAIEVGMTVGQQNMYNYMRKFGFGQRTGIQLPAESPGKLRKLERWGKTSLASVSMGQEVSVTTVQLAQAAAVVANGGFLVKPRLVLRKGDAAVPPAQPVAVLKSATAVTMRQMMEGVVLFGTGTQARIVGYTVGGKTGSAQIFDVASHHYTHTYNGSFMGMTPMTNPALVAVVTLNGTHGTAGFGGQSAAPVFRVVAAEALRVMDVPKDNLPADTAVLTQVVKAQESDDLADADVDSEDPNILEDGDGDNDAAAAAVRPRVPNFKGMSMRSVLAEAASKGLTVVPNGSGVARAQVPRAGAILHDGERIRVQFAR